MNNNYISIMISFAKFFFHLFSLVILLVTDRISTNPDRIAKLPGQPLVDFDQYSGYIEVGPEKSLFYYLVETPGDSGTKPLLLWLHGRPGCSGVGAGAFQEIGPFRVSQNGITLYQNPYAWNNVANVLFVDSPVGVGFSYGVENNTGDESVAEQSHVFLDSWLERFPVYKNRDLYIAGEGYVGHHAPQLALLILQNNETSVSLKGVALGNPLLEDGSNYLDGYYEYLWTHAMLSDLTYTRLKRSCNFTDILALNPECRYYVDKAIQEMGRVDPYNPDRPVCSDMGLVRSRDPASETVDVYDPCAFAYVQDYMNSKQVQIALHTKPLNWGLCTAQLEWKDSPHSVVPVIQELIAKNVSICLYSGDTNAVVPFTSTKKTISSMNLRIKTHWHPWYTDNQVGGYVVGYEGLVFATIRGAGQQVSSYQPRRSLTLISSFLKGTLPPFRP